MLILKNHFELSHLGITTKNASHSLKHAIIITVVGFIVLTSLGFALGFKTLTINQSWLAFYLIISVPVQEIIFRGIIQNYLVKKMAAYNDSRTSYLYHDSSTSYLYHNSSGAGANGKVGINKMKTRAKENAAGKPKANGNFLSAFAFLSKMKERSVPEKNIAAGKYQSKGLLALNFLSSASYPQARNRTSPRAKNKSKAARNAIVLASLIYAIIHFRNPLLIILTFIAGLAWGWSFYKRPTLIGPMVSHAILGVYLFLFVL